MPDWLSFLIMSDDFSEDLIIKKGNRATNMRKTTMGGQEMQHGSVLAQNAKHTNIDLVLQVFLSQVFRNGAFLLHSTHIEFFADTARELACSRQRSSTNQNCFVI